MTSRNLILVLILAISSQSFAANRLKVNTERRMLEDEHGRTVILHGFNSVYKVHPYIPDRDHFDPETSLTNAEIKDLVDLGFNFMRLGVMWEAVETAPGVYNDTYLQEINSLINEMGSYGVYTLVDAHQDVFARALCGEGVPNFYAQSLQQECPSDIPPILEALYGRCKAVADYGYRKDQNGNPLIEDCQSHNFVGYYMSPES